MTSISPTSARGDWSRRKILMYPRRSSQSISQLVGVEAQTQAQAGAPIDAMSIRDRTFSPDGSRTRKPPRKRAAKQAKVAEDKIDEILSEGKFYEALGGVSG